MTVAQKAGGHLGVQSSQPLAYADSRAEPTWATSEAQGPRESLPLGPTPPLCLAPPASALPTPHLLLCSSAPILSTLSRTNAADKFAQPPGITEALCGKSFAGQEAVPFLIFHLLVLTHTCILGQEEEEGEAVSRRAGRTGILQFMEKGILGTFIYLKTF